MHALFVCESKFKAAKRVARVLDGFALRHGERTWMTPITRQALLEVRRLLRLNVSRNTAVACYINGGQNQMRLEWVVGRRDAFGPEGIVTVASTAAARPAPQPLPVASRVSALLAACAGLAHDLGKFGEDFQRKLREAGPVKDPVRHEWLSLHLLRHMRAGATWEEAWRAPLVRMKDVLGAEAGLAGGLQSADAALDYLVFTHHRLPGEDGNIVGDGSYTSEGAGVRTYRSHAVAAPLAALWTRLSKLRERLLKLCEGQNSPVFWRAVATQARMALILADHSISSIDASTEPGSTGAAGAKKAYANTRKSPSGNRVLNQELNWHLTSVGSMAARVVFGLSTMTFRGLQGDGVGRICELGSGRFSWQNTCAVALAAGPRVPTLVVNVAGTGAGKTRMNLRALAALRQGEPLRITSALNLVALTLQTRDAYVEQLNLNPHDVACVIGNRTTEAMHRAAGGSQKDETDDDNNPVEDEFDVVGEGDEAPHWLAPFLRRRPQMVPLLTAPVAVCTIDYLGPAGEPQRQANHALAMCRISTSDLVLDELDSYEPKAMVAVLRLVTAAAMWGRHVIASSATLPAPVAAALWSAYDLGARMRAALSGGQGEWCQAFIGDVAAPETLVCGDAQDFESRYRAHVSDASVRLGHRRYRPVELEPVAATGSGGEEELFDDAVLRGCRVLHERHRRQVVTGFGAPTMSVGLVRVANIRTAVTVARRLSELPNTRVCCYHSQLGAVQRFHVERSLDRLLTRKTGSACLIATPELEEAAGRAQEGGQDDVMLIVVATPVEEIGRDHDFDWAVVEPSSTQSLVQVVGRVNRHRLLEQDEPNVAILQFNRRYCRSGATRGAFRYPGLEGERLYGTYDLGVLLNWEQLRICGQVDARLRFDDQSHDFSRHDNDATAEAIKKYLKPFLQSDSSRWLGEGTYSKAPLRDRSTITTTWSRDTDGNYLELCPEGRDWRFLRRSPLPRVERTQADWLVLSFGDAKRLAMDMGLKTEAAFRVDLSTYNSKDSRKPLHDESFGYQIER